MTTTYSWGAGTSGDWNTATSWAGGLVPPNDGLADIVIDTVPATGSTDYTVTIAQGESVTVDSIILNGTNNVLTVNQQPYVGAILEIDGTLTFAPASQGLLGGPLQSSLNLSSATIVNAGTVTPYVVSAGITNFTGTNAIYFTDALQSLGTVTIDTKEIGEYGTRLGTLAAKTLSDGIFEAKGTGAVVNFGGSGGGLIVNIATLEGPGIDYAPGLPGYTQLVYDGPTSEIMQWNGSAYASVESTLTTIENNATVDVNVDPLSKIARDYTTTNALTISATGTLGALFYQQGGTLTTGGVTTIGNGTLSGAATVIGNITNDGTIMASDGDMILQGSVTGSGILTFDTTVGVGPGTLDVQAVSAGETVTLLGGNELIIESPATFKAAVSDVGVNTIMLMGVVANTATVTGGVLDIYNGTTLVDAITLSGSLSGGISVSKVGNNTSIGLGGAVLSKPTLVAGASVGYTAGGAAATLDAAVLISDNVSTTLSGATVTISSGFLAGDTLTVTDQAGITSSYNAATGQLTLTGTATLATYQKELDLVAFSSTAKDPTNAAADPTRTVSWMVNDGQGTATATSSLSITVPPPPPPPPIGTLSPTMTSDVFLQSDTGAITIWQLNGASLTASGQIGLNPTLDWQIRGLGDFFKNGDTDILWQSNTGSIAIWDMQGSKIVGGGVIGLNPGPDWQIKGTGNFLGDGNTDILWQNTDGSVAIWDVRGTNIIGGGIIGLNPGPDWQIKGTGNFFADGNTDILWQNTDGSVAIWDMKGTSIVGGGIIGVNPGSTWHIEGVGNFFGNGNTDIAWQNDDGSVAIWSMNGTTIANGGIIGVNPGSTWHLTGTGNFFGQGTQSLLFQNDDGSTAVWGMKGTTITGGGIISASGASLHAYGSSGMFFINGETGNGTLTATIDPDEFVLTSFSTGAHTIAGFLPGQDIIELSKSLFPTFADVQAATTASAGGALINLGHSSTLMLSGVNPSTLHATNFALT